MSRQLDDTYCEIVFFILISLGLFHSFILKVKLGSDRRRDERGGMTCCKGATGRI